MTRRRMLIISTLALGTALCLWAIYLGRPAPLQQQRYGVSFSSRQAASLGLVPEQAYLALFDDLGVRHLRLAAYWDVVQPEPDTYDFSELDWQLDEASSHGASVVLAVGRKLPRWPECFVPAWASKALPAQQRDWVLAMVRVVVERYRDNPAVSKWQLENEPFVSWFGHCPAPDPILLAAERDLIRSLSSKPIITTDSGELSSWRRAARFTDVLGTTMYRVTWNPWFGYGYYPLPAGFYRMKARLWGLEPKDVIVSELQAEPWPPGTSMVDTSIEEQFRSMDVKRLNENLQFARDTGFGDVYLWGAEWWLWVKEEGHPELWNEARKLFRQS